MNDIKWSTVAVCALPLFVGAALIITGHEAEASKLLALGAGLLVGLPMTWRKPSGKSNPPPPPTLIPSAVVIAALSGAWLAGCGGGSTAPSTVCRAARAAQAACHIVDNVADYACAAPETPDGGVR